MPDVRRCVIFGCQTNSRDHREVCLFSFPSQDSPFYSKWLSLCEESVETISKQRRPFICAKHFHKEDVRYRRLAKGALPAFFLTAPPGFAEEEAARVAKLEFERSEKVRLLSLMNETVLEWVRRAQHCADTVSTCKKRRQLMKIARRVRNLLGATLLVGVDDHWLRKFRRVNMVALTQEDPEKSRKKTLNLRQIIAGIDPNTKILSEAEITALLKEEKIQIAQNGGKRKKVYTNSVVAVGAQSKKSTANGNEGASENAFTEYSGHSILDKTRDDSMFSGCYQENSECYQEEKSECYQEEKSECYQEKSECYQEEKSECYQVKSECIDVKPECEDSIDLMLNDDDDMDRDAVNDMEDICNEADQSTKSEIVIDSYQQAMEYLKPVEDFVLKQENYRAIGLLSTLESIFTKSRIRSD